MLSFSSVIPARQDKNLPCPTWPSPRYSRPTPPRTPNLSAMPKCNRRATSVPVENSCKTKGDGCLRCQSGTGQNVTCDRSGFNKSQTLESNPDSLLVWFEAAHPRTRCVRASRYGLAATRISRSRLCLRPFFQSLVRSHAIHQVAGSGLSPDNVARQTVTHPSRITLTLGSLTVPFEAFPRIG
jgi:hypothetical protein